MGLVRLIALSCACAIAVTAVAFRDAGDVLAGDVNGDHRIDVLDLQAVITKVLHDTQGAALPGSGANVNVLDFQRILTLLERPAHPDTTPPVKPTNKGCFFRYQSGWIEAASRPLMVEVEDAVSLDLSAKPLSRAPQFDHPTPWRLPPFTERYLFHLVSNAPPA